MSHPEPKIQCSSHQCLTFNHLKAKICDECQTPIVRRYLWSREKAISTEQKQTVVDDRYLALSEQIFLDTQPTKPPQTPEEVPPEIVVYLQLFSYYPHIPQPFGLLGDRQTWLFDYGTIPLDAEGEPAYSSELIPKLEDLWLGATPLQQLNWLWQIAKLWHPLDLQGVAATLSEPDLIKINGQILQLQYLQPQAEQKGSLKDLGRLWSKWAKNAHPDIKDAISQLANRLETGIVAKSDRLLGLLDRAIALHCQSLQYSYQVYAQTDSGPTRSNNEDAAYPLNSDLPNIEGKGRGLAIVCDGVGGHDGGEIASGDTVKHLYREISALKTEQLHPLQICSKLDSYIRDANDLISQRNDSEQRQERQRMGTTLVMTFGCAQEMYLSHVGDSRIYWITRNSCHQITIDDDLASREVRLGYALYRDSLQYPSAGALIQALGMRDSAALHPNLQRFIIDGECVFLLCTDGLSDFDRVEQQWQQNILPLLENKQKLANTVEELIALANDKNGHDNVTVALVHCQVQTLPGSSQATVAWSDLEPVLAESAWWSGANQIDPWSDATSREPASASAKTTEEKIGERIGESAKTKQQYKWIKPLVLILFISTIVGLFSYQQLQQAPDDYSPPSESNPETDISR